MHVLNINIHHRLIRIKGGGVQKSVLEKLPNLEVNLFSQFDKTNCLGDRTESPPVCSTRFDSGCCQVRLRPP